MIALDIILRLRRAQVIVGVFFFFQIFTKVLNLILVLFRSIR